MKYIVFKKSGGAKFTQYNNLCCIHPAILIPNVIIVYSKEDDEHFFRRTAKGKLSYNGLEVSLNRYGWCCVIAQNLLNSGYTEQIKYPH